MPNYIIIGASGLIGGHIVMELLKQPQAVVTSLVRKPLTQKDARLNEVIIDFTDLQALKDAVAGADAVFVAIGTTQQKVKGDMKAYQKVDYDIPIAAAKACVTSGIPQLLLVSSVGANSRSKNFYLRIKGEVEDAITAMPIPSIHIFQPSLLLGNRKEFRLGERISQFLMPLLAFLLPKPYRPIAAASVAKAMVNTASENKQGIHRYTFETMVE